MSCYIGFNGTAEVVNHLGINGHGTWTSGYEAKEIGSVSSEISPLHRPNIYGHCGMACKTTWDDNGRSRILEYV